MLKNKILPAIIALVLGTSSLMAQKTLQIDNARLLGALPNGASYSSGGSVAIPFNINGCIAAPNVLGSTALNWILLDSLGHSTGITGSVPYFYATFINITLPDTLSTHQYKVGITIATGTGGGDTSVLFPVKKLLPKVNAKASPTVYNLILVDQYYFGICDGKPLNNMVLQDSSVGTIDSLELIDNYHLPLKPSVKFVPNGSGKINLLFNPTTNSSGRRRDAFYTAYLKSIGAGNTVSTIGYQIINNRWAIESNILSKPSGSTTSCKGDTVTLHYTIDTIQNEHLQQNFPGALISVDWNDGTSGNSVRKYYTQCEILAANGNLTHVYTKPACSVNGSINYVVTSTVTNPFNIFGGPGITSTCAAGAKTSSEALVFSPPKASFKTDTVICAMDTLHFFNISDPGQGVVNSSGLTVCAQLANYTYYVDYDSTHPFYQTPINPGLEPRKDTAYSWLATQPGYHTVTLLVSNAYGTDAPCPTDDTTRRICVDTARVRPDFKMDSAGVLKDSILGCAPDICIKNATRSTFCVDSTHFNYKWRVLDASTPGPNYAIVPNDGIAYYYTSGKDTSREPCISIVKTGKYFIELNASATCSVDTTLRMLKYVEANGSAGVRFPLFKDTIAYCGYPTQPKIVFDPTKQGFRDSFYFGNPTNPFSDSILYTYQASSAGALSYLWTIGKVPQGSSVASPAVYGTDYVFLGGAGQLDSTIQYPTIQFKTVGLYKITVSFNNNCKTKTAVQYVAYRQQPNAFSGSTIGATDSICHTTSSFNLTGAHTTGGAVGKIVWTVSGVGINSDSYITPNSADPAVDPTVLTNPVLHVGTNDAALACANGLTLDINMSAYAPSPTNCSILGSIRHLFIRPCVSLSDTEFNSCSGSSVNYAITQPSLYHAAITWTSNVVGGGFVNPPSTNNLPNVTTITDVLQTNPAGSDAIVEYTVYPTKDGCPGNPFIVRDTVRGNPLAPNVTVKQPSNTPPSMCSGDYDSILITSANAADTYVWNSYNNQGQITGMSTGNGQPSPIHDQLFNTGAALVVDTANYCVKVANQYGCTGAQTCVQVIVTPGPPVAKVTEPTKLLYLCDSACGTLSANDPGAAGIGTWTIQSYQGQLPTIANIHSYNTQVCGLTPNKSYYFKWEIAPLATGCNITSDVLNIQVTDSLPTPFAGNDTSICDANGVSSRNIVINGSLSRPLGSQEFIQWRFAAKPTSSNPALTPVNGSGTMTPLFTFTDFGTYVLEATVFNGTCPAKKDTIIVRVYGKPTSGSISANPIQNSFCQGSNFTLTANFNTNLGTISQWEDSLLNPPNTHSVIAVAANSLTQTASQSADYKALILSKGWNFGCKDSTYTVPFSVKVDSATIAGTIGASDTVVCTPNSVVLLTVNGNRGDVKGWIRSSTGLPGSYGGVFAIGNPTSVSVATTTWYQALVQNGNCTLDTTAPIMVQIPPGASTAVTGNDTAICGGTTVTLTGNIPTLGHGYWQMVQGQANGATGLNGGVFTFGLSNPTDTTSLNPINVNIANYGTYKFVWTVGNLTCPGSSDAIIIKNTQPIDSNRITVVADTVCSGTTLNFAGITPIGGSGVFQYSWQYSTNGGTIWTTDGTLGSTYSYVAGTNVWVRRVVQSDSCYSTSNVIAVVVQPAIANNIISTSPVCINTLAPTIIGSLPTGGAGSGSYTYAWDTANNIHVSTGFWVSANATGQSYTPGVILTDTFNVRRTVTSGKCTSVSAVASVYVNPDAKASFLAIGPNNNTRCAPYQIGTDIINNVLPNTQYNWYLDTTGGSGPSLVNTGNQFNGYSILKGLDSARVTLVALSTNLPACKSDTMRVWFHTSATPVASFTVSADSGCASNTVNVTNFAFTNTTAYKSLFPNELWNLNSTTLTNSGLVDFPVGTTFQYGASSTGLDTTYTITLTVNSPQCGSSQASHTIKVRTKPTVLFSLSPTYQCSGLPVNFTNNTVGSSNLAWAWTFGDGVGTSSVANPTYTYTVPTLTTLYPKLVASNECASDSLTRSVTIAANTVALSISKKTTNGTPFSCLPDTVWFYSNSSGATSYIWDFGDNTQSAPSVFGIDSVQHIYTTAGEFIVTLTGSTSCGNTTLTDSVFVYSFPNVNYTITPNISVCKGDTVHFNNQFNDSTTYVWNFNVGNSNTTVSGTNPTTVYGASGTYATQVTATKTHKLPAPFTTIGCTATSGIQTVSVRDTMPATFSITQLGRSCLPDTLLFTNTSAITTLPILSTIWSWADGSPNVQTNAPVTHIYSLLGSYNVNLTVLNAGGCTYIDSSLVNVAGPTGTWSHDTGYICSYNLPVKFQLNATNTDSVTVNFGDGPTTTVTLANFATLIPHTYVLGGTYYPSVILKSANGCTFNINAFGPVRVDYVKASYIENPLQTPCGSSTLSFTNTSHVDQLALPPVYNWNINGVAYNNTISPSVTFNTTGIYNVRMQVISVSGCSDTVATAAIPVKVNNIPNILSITRQDTVCANQVVYYTAIVSPSEDLITNYNWSFGNGTTGSGVSSQTVFGTQGAVSSVYYDTLTIVTSNNCKNTVITGPLVVNGVPIVSVNPSVDTAICATKPLALTAFSSGIVPVVSYTWVPNDGSLNTTTGPNVMATPTVTTKYVVTGTSARGCSDTAGVFVAVVQPFTVTVNPPSDSICLGTKITLTANGATGAGSYYTWSPANDGLDTLGGVSVIAQPKTIGTHIYTVTGHDAANCTQPTFSVTIGVGDTLHVSLGLDTVVLQGGTNYQLNASVINGPVDPSGWSWTPSTGLSCTNCGNPVAAITENTCYHLDATSVFNCKASTNICIVAFCEAGQVSIPNAFTPDNDGINDFFFVRATSGITVTSFRVFNRWGQVVFERANYTPDPFTATTPNSFTAWNGKINGVVAPTDIYVYTCDVVCATGTKFTYKGNVALIK